MGCRKQSEKVFILFLIYVYIYTHMHYISYICMLRLKQKMIQCKQKKHICKLNHTHILKRESNKHLYVVKLEREGRGLTLNN